MVESSSALPWVEITELAADGRGIGVWSPSANAPSAKAKAAVVCQAYPGDRVQVAIDIETEGAVQGRVHAFDRSAARAEHSCPHEHACTGCPLLALSAEQEARFKWEKIARALMPVVGQGARGHARLKRRLAPVMSAASPWRYRHFAKWAVGMGADLHTVVLGSYVHGTHQIVSNRGCSVLAPALSALMGPLEDALSKMLQEHAKHSDGVDKKHSDSVDKNPAEQLGVGHVLARLGSPSGVVLLTVVAHPKASLLQRKVLAERMEAWVQSQTGPFEAVVGAALLQPDANAGNALLRGDIVAEWGQTHVMQKLGCGEHRIGAQSFFQINPTMGARLAEVVVDFATGKRSADEVCLEGFAGVGALTLPLLARFARVVAVESHPDAVASLRTHAEAAADGALMCRQGDAYAELPDMAAQHRAQVVVLDPPRRGVGIELGAALCRVSSIKRVVLVHCAPKHLGRDLVPWLEGGFRWRKTQPLDLFARTAHVETVTLLERGVWR